MKRYEPLYFGCANGSAGHYVWVREFSMSKDRHDDWLSCLDGKLPPEGEQTEGKARLHHFNGCTLLAFWDRSVDSRGGCNSVFVIPGRVEFDEAVASAKKQWPHVWARFKFEVYDERREMEQEAKRIMGMAG